MTSDAEISRPSPSQAGAASFPAPAARTRLLWAAILGSAMGFIDGSVLAIAIPAIREDLGATLPQAQWVSNAYMVTLSALILAGGAIGDRFGTARMFGLGIAGFILSSLICAVAPTANLLVAARGLQGAAAALMVPGSLALIARAYPRDERGRAIGAWAAASALTTAAGPLLGGLLLSLDSPGIWRWIFAANLPLGGLALWLMRDALRGDRGRPDRPLDLTGATLATLGLGLLAAGLTSAEGSLPLAAGGLALIGGFVAWEARIPHPMMPLALFRDRGFSATNAATFALYAALSAVLFFLPMLLVAGWGLSEFQTSLAFAPLSVAIFLMSSRFGAMADRVGPGPLIASGAAVVALAYGWLALAVGTQAFWAGVMPPMVLAGLGMAMVVAPLSAAVMGAVSESDSGAASGINNAISRVAGLLAVAALGGVAAGVYATAGGTLSYGEAGTTSGHAEAMTSAFAIIAWVSAALAALSSVAAFLGIPRRREPSAQDA